MNTQQKYHKIIFLQNSLISQLQMEEISQGIIHGFSIYFSHSFSLILSLLMVHLSNIHEFGLFPLFHYKGNRKGQKIKQMFIEIKNEFSDVHLSITHPGTTNKQFTLPHTLFHVKISVLLLLLLPVFDSICFNINQS